MHQGPDEKTLLQDVLEPGEPPVLAPGHTFGTVTDKITSIVLRRPLGLGWAGAAFIGFVFVLSLIHI